MKMLLAVLLVPALTACAVFRGGPSADDYTCNADGLAELAGQQASTPLAGDAMRRSGARALRWIRPGDMVTMDFRADRLNIYLTAEGRIERVACG